MSIDNKEWLLATNDFSLLGLKFLYLSNGGAIVAILSNIKIFEKCYYIVFWPIINYIIGLFLAFMSNFCAYFLYRTILLNKQNNTNKPYECWMHFAVIFSVLSCLAFFYSSYILITTFLFPFCK